MQGNGVAIKVAGLQANQMRQPVVAGTAGRGTTRQSEVREKRQTEGGAMGTESESERGSIRAVFLACGRQRLWG